MALDDEVAVEYSVRSIGSVPVMGPAWHVERELKETGPLTAVDMLAELNIGDRLNLPLPQFRGAALALVRSGRAHRYRKKLVLVSAGTAAR